ncbi:hypothetical protein AGMMS50276_24690 [Synergistales bacterium]|nr:hypothetical protein AGMMS50276_24690 [Synergistales bacterium]
MQQYTREEMLSGFRKIRSEGRHIITAGAGSGLSAKSIEHGGADMLLVFNSGSYRMQGHGSLSGWLACGNANDVAMDMGLHYVLPAVNKIPVICGVFAQDVTKVISNHIDRVIEAGFSGVNNFPTVGMMDGKFREQLEATGLGFDKEVEMVRVAAKKNIFTFVYAFNEDESRRMAEAGADCIVSHVGLTVGGATGATKSLSIEDSAVLTRKIMQAGKEKKKDVIWLAHGGPLATPEDIKNFLGFLPEIDGFVGASSVEKVPAERAISETVKKLMNIA